MPTKKSRNKRAGKRAKTKHTSKAVKPKVAKSQKQPSRKKAPQLLVKSKKDHKLFWIIVLFCCLQIASGILWYQLYAKTVLSFAVSPSVSATYITSGSPTEIIIPDAHIDLTVTPTNIEQGVWQIPDTSAAHLASSAQPGQGGNVLVYAHNKKNLFGSLKEVKEGDIITIHTTAKTKHQYQVREILTVNPQDISIAMPTDHEVLTVYTCTGFLDSQRLVVKAYPVSVSTL
jgi:LPXTG-site transpeptidase (sortase) family protein